MDWKTKTIIGAIIALILSILAFIIKIQYDTIQKLKTIETSVVEAKNLGNNLMRAQGSYVNKSDLERMIKERDVNLDAIKKDLAKMGASVDDLLTIDAESIGQDQEHIPSSGSQALNPNNEKPIVPDKVKCPDGTSVTCPNPDKYNYLTRTLILNFDENFDKQKIPLGTVKFTGADKDPWSLKIYPRKYDVTTVLGQDEEGRHYAYSKFSITANGKTETIPIKSTLKQEVPSSSFRLDPRIYLSVDSGITTSGKDIKGEVLPGIMVSFLSYGKTKTDPDWTFLDVGVGYATQRQTVGFVFAPVNYNVGHHLPGMRNLHLGPAVSVDTGGNFGLYLGARVGL
jgi:hypothetical protein